MSPRARPRRRARTTFRPRRVLVVDIGGTNVKIAAPGSSERLKIPSGRALTPERLVRRVLAIACGWRYDAVSIGYPGIVIHGRIAAEPGNLGWGWVGFDFEGAFERPVRIANDAVMQALGSFDRGPLLFLGFGTAIGCALISKDEWLPIEIGHMRHRPGRSLQQYVGKQVLRRHGKRKWTRRVLRVVAELRAVVGPHVVVVGGGGARALVGVRLPRGVRRGDNSDAIAGGVRLWSKAWDDVRPSELRRSRGRE